MKRVMPAPASSRAGQTIVEFAFVSMLFISMLSLTFNAILAFCTQQYLSYAVFMSARAYQSAGANPEDQKNNAIRTLQSYLPNLPNSPGSGLTVPLKFKSFGKSMGNVTAYYVPDPSRYDYGQADPSQLQIRVEFSAPFVEFPIAAEMRQRFGTVPLRANSFLGREVSQSECHDFFHSFLNTFQIPDPAVSNAYRQFAENDNYYRNMEDNGC